MTTLTMASAPHRRVLDGTYSLPPDLVAAVRHLDGTTVEMQPWHDRLVLAGPVATVTLAPDDSALARMTSWVIDGLVHHHLGFGYAEPVQVTAVEVDERPAAVLTALDGTVIATLRAADCAECGAVPETDAFENDTSDPLWCDSCCDDIDLWSCETCAAGFRDSEDGGHRNGGGVWCNACHDPTQGWPCTVHDDCHAKGTE